jgi:hypothetical protein
MRRGKVSLFWTLLFLVATATDARDVVVKLYDVTPDCRATVTNRHQVCVSPNEKIVGTPTTIVTTKNGDSRVVDEKPDPTNPSCFVITVQVAPLGEQCVLGICNCRGNGWLGLDMHLQAAPR